ncbi:MAG: L-2-hydroxyglutarate oxidase [Kineosporiaceae bacterium]
MPTSEGVCVIGAGILGLAVARELGLRHPGLPVTVVDKESRVAAHQSGHNSCVVHAGLYYEPGSLKATLCRRGGSMLRDYCAEHAIRYDELGKVVVASSPAELPALRRIGERAERNGVPGLRFVDPVGLREIEPWAVGVAALHSPHTATVDFPAVCRRLADDVRESGGQVLLGQEVDGIRTAGEGVEVTLKTGPRRFAAVVACAGLGSDRVGRGGSARAPGGARVPGGAPGREVRIVPFRGEYWRLRGAARDRVRGLIYPVPDPRYPFLGVHLTRRFDGEVLVGPNAVMALAREGYRWRDVDLVDLAELARWPGLWRLARRHWRTGVREMRVSLSKRAFLTAAQRYVPSLAATDLARAASGVRAQAVGRDGSLVDDFVIDVHGPIVAVRNAPSPAATSSLAIAEYVADRVPVLGAA